MNEQKDTDIDFGYRKAKLFPVNSNLWVILQISLRLNKIYVDLRLPVMSQGASNRAIPQSKEALLKSYTLRLKDDVKSMLDNYTEVIKLARVEEESQLAKSTQAEQDQYEMQVRAANIVRAGESLMKLVSDLKIFLILNDFPSVNDSISNKTQLYKHLQNDLDAKLLSLRDELANDLYELEEEYYSSVHK